MAKQRKPIPKTQKELSKQLQEPYIPPVGAPGFSTVGNPNDANTVNRATQTSFKNDTVKPISIGLEDLDWAIMYYFQNVIRPTVKQNDEMIPVPIIYGSPEKWASFKKQGYLRDLKGRLMAQLLMFKRNNIEKNISLTNKLDANDPHNIAVTNKKYSPQNAYSKFNILNGIKPEQTLYATVVPDYITVTYDCAIFTYYNDQLNKIIEAVEYASDAYWGDPERFKFKTNIDSFSSTIELSDNAERIVKSTFTLKMFGYIIPDVSQKDTKFIPKFSDKNRVLFTTETTLDINNLPTSL